MVTTSVQLEIGRNVRWRGLRWRVLAIEEGGFVRLTGIDATNRHLEVTPLLDLEGDALTRDELPVPELDVKVTDRARWRAMHQAFIASSAGGREQLIGLDWGRSRSSPTSSCP